jgi:formate dehydrogenase alpha subunit
VAGLVTTFGSGAMTNSIRDISDAACIIAIGTNTTEAHPVIALEFKKAANKGGKLIVANTREIDLVRDATIWLRHRPGTDVALLMGMARVIVDEGLADTAFIEERCENFEEFKESLRAFDLATVEDITGVPAEKIAEAARIYATNSPAAIFYAMGITQHTHGTDNVIATANLAMLTGNVGKPSAGVNPLRGQNNVQGACDLGALPNVYPGYQSVADTAIKDKFERAWDAFLSDKPGLTITEMFDGAYEGTIKAMYIIGENPPLSEPNANHAIEALKRLDFLVVQDIFMSETAELADVVLPAASSAEKDGTYTNTERRVQRVRKAIEPIGDARPDWLITCQIAQKMGIKGFEFENPSGIMEEIASLTPAYGGITYERLEQGGLQWPCPTPEHPGTPILHIGIFSRGKGHFVPLEYKPSAELPDEEYPLLLTTGRNLFHWHTGTMTRRVGGLDDLLGEGWVDISPADAEKLGIAHGDRVKITSRRGSVFARANVTDVSDGGVVYMNMHFAESAVNVLTNPALDPVSKIPEFKVSAVKISKSDNG